MDIKISELSSINQADLEPDDIFLVVRGGQWTKTISASQLYRLSTDNIIDGILDVKYGGVGADLSQTGGTKHYVKQLATGAGLTTGQIQSEDLPTSLYHVGNIGGTNSLSIGTQADTIYWGNALSDDYIYGAQVTVDCDSLNLSADSILLAGNTVDIGGNNSDVLIGGINSDVMIVNGVLINGNTVITGSMTVSEIFTPIANIQTLKYAASNQSLLYGNSGTIAAFGSVTNTLVGYGSGSLTHYTGSQLATFLGTNSIDGIAKTNISINNANIGAEKTINFIPSGLTMTGVDSGTQVDLTLSVAAGDNTASKIYLWSNYR